MPRTTGASNKRKGACSEIDLRVSCRGKRFKLNNWVDRVLRTRTTASDKRDSGEDSTEDECTPIDDAEIYGMLYLDSHLDCLHLHQMLEICKYLGIVDVVRLGSTCRRMYLEI